MGVRPLRRRKVAVAATSPAKGVVDVAYVACEGVAFYIHVPLKSAQLAHYSILLSPILKLRNPDLDRSGNRKLAVRPKKITYVTSSDHKMAEKDVFVKHCRLADGSVVEDLFEFDIRPVAIKEVLEVDLRAMVRAEVKEAYSKIKVPCIVEHAGLIFADHQEQSYPGGLTKPMWNALGDQFVKETGSANRRAIARAVVAYCDGMSVETFIGETLGTIACCPRGSRTFYWDTVFVPDDPTGQVQDMTYAEIVDDPRWGLEYKMSVLSQSAKALLSFLEYRLKANSSLLWGRDL